LFRFIAKYFGLPEDRKPEYEDKQSGYSHVAHEGGFDLSEYPSIQQWIGRIQSNSKYVGSMLIEQVKDYGKKRNWTCIELCTPPLPEFKRTLNFYQKNGLNPVGGRKMRQMLG